MPRPAPSTLVTNKINDDDDGTWMMIMIMMMMIPVLFAYRYNNDGQMALHGLRQ